jgi:hypothetical protein
MTEQAVNIWVRGSDGLRRETVLAFARIGDWCTHHPHGGGAGYEVTHTPSGASVVHCTTLHAAYAAMYALEPLRDISRPDHAGKFDPKAAQRHREDLQRIADALAAIGMQAGGQWQIVKAVEP